MLLAIALTLAAAVTPATVSTATELVTKAELTLASAVLNREAQPLPEKVVAGQTVFAFTQVTGPGGGYVEHVWTRDGKEVARHYLPLGQSKRWRTWSKHKVSAGQYQISVLAQNGERLQEATLEVSPAAMDNDE